ncbi:response regulator transcription factor [Flavobacterium sp.]|uniref:response regulator transcription factor n=1 Tax=Flavobacterium sp. TaxID=239 RepID=UPI002616C6B5|nr:response regulator transcription factor [Flavobacterium sp.]
MKKISIAIVDDKRLLRNTLTEQIQYNQPIEVLFTAENGIDFLQQMEKRPKNNQPLVVLMDIEMPEMDGIETVLIAKEIYPDIQFLMLTAFSEDEKIFDAVKAGASGYLLKDESIAKIISSISELLYEGSVPMSPIVAKRTLEMLKVSEKSFQKTENESEVESDVIEYLTSRERDILQEIVSGLNYKEIADKLFISPHTVRKHIANIYEKLHVSNKTAAIKIALKKKWF